MSWPLHNDWERWFAWYPVWTDRGPRWLCRVWRQRWCHPSWDEYRHYWEYRV